MTDFTNRAGLLAGAAVALAVGAAGCGRGATRTAEGETAAATPAAVEAASHHPETFEAARTLAAGRNAPLLVDFYSPT